jgi:hypothetical protein
VLWSFATETWLADLTEKSPSIGVALIVFMAHCGSFVPAQSAFIGLTDKILTRLSTRESVSKVRQSALSLTDRRLTQVRSDIVSLHD